MRFFSIKIQNSFMGSSGTSGLFLGYNLASLPGLRAGGDAKHPARASHNQTGHGARGKRQGDVGPSTDPGCRKAFIKVAFVTADVPTVFARMLWGSSRPVGHGDEWCLPGSSPSPLPSPALPGPALKSSGKWMGLCTALVADKTGGADLPHCAPRPHLGRCSPLHRGGDGG